jgi:hypothetical protein
MGIAPSENEEKPVVAFSFIVIVSIPGEAPQPSPLSYCGLPSWPPVWGHLSSKQGTEPLKGEIGVLRRVSVSSLVSKKCFLTIEYNGPLFLGCLLVADQSFCNQIAKLLQSYCGHSIEEIGGLDISGSL